MPVAAVTHPAIFAEGQFAEGRLFAEGQALSKGFFAEDLALPRVLGLALGKDPFAECPRSSPR